MGIPKYGPYYGPKAKYGQNTNKKYRSVVNDYAKCKKTLKASSVTKNYLTLALLGLRLTSLKSI